MTLNTYIGILEVASGIIGTGFALWGLRGASSMAGTASERPVAADSVCPCGSGKTFRHCHGELLEEERSIEAMPHSVKLARTASRVMATFVLGFAIATTFAGVLLFRGQPLGRSLSFLLQGVQIPSLSIAGVTYQLAVGLVSEWGIKAVSRPGDVGFGFNLDVRPGVRVDFGIRGDRAQFSAGVNVAALALFLVLWRGL